MTQPDPERHNLLVNAARLHYLRRLTHQQIADKLGLSRVKVTRLLQQAVDDGIVEFRIADPLSDTLELQDQLEERFGLQRAVVTPVGDSHTQTLESLARSAAGLLMGSINDRMTVGLGWGRTLNAMTPFLVDAQCEGVRVVSLTGGLAANSNQPNPYDTTTAVASRIHAEPHYLVLPAMVASARTRTLLMQEPSAIAITELWGHMDLCLMSIGRLSEHTGIFYAFPDPAAEVKRVREMGGVGDLLARPYDLQGTFLDVDFADRTITVDLDLLRSVPQVIGVSGGRGKEDAVLGALRTGLLAGLITDEATARTVLKHS